jgi:hypothetical protein
MFSSPGYPVPGCWSAAGRKVKGRPSERSDGRPVPD